MPDVVERVDDLQRRRRAAGLPLAVVYKFFDDQGNYLAATLTYYAFIAIFPLLLIASSVLGFVLQGSPQLQKELLSSTLSQFPIVGTQLGQPGGLQGSVSAVVVGALAALYGVIGLGQAAQNTINVAWAIPRNSRYNPIRSRLLSLVLLVVGGVAVLLVAISTSLANNLDVFGGNINVGLRWLATLVSVVLSAFALAVMMSLAASRRHSIRTVLPGAVAIAVMWHVLQSLGGFYVSHVINRVSAMNAVFALVLGLFALLYIAAVIAVLGIEINVVLAKRLYPRSLLTPFTDDVELTNADRQVYTDRAKAQRHKGFETVTVTFEPRPADDRKDDDRPSRR